MHWGGGPSLSLLSPAHYAGGPEINLKWNYDEKKDDDFSGYDFVEEDWDISYEEYREIVFNDWDEPEL